MHKKILIVDDSKTWQLFHKDLIEQLYGDLFNITFADSAAEAFNIISNNINTPFCLVISDLQMETNFEPKLAGVWLVENIRTLSAYFNNNIVIVSAMSDIESIAHNLGVECIPKSMLIKNKLLMKFMMEKLLPFLNSI